MLVGNFLSFQIENVLFLLFIKSNLMVMLHGVDKVLEQLVFIFQNLQLSILNQALLGLIVYLFIFALQFIFKFNNFPIFVLFNILHSCMKQFFLYVFFRLYLVLKKHELGLCLMKLLSIFESQLFVVAFTIGNILGDHDFIWNIESLCLISG